MHFLSLAAVTAYAAGVLAVPNPHRMVQHERRAQSPKQWLVLERAPADMELPVRIGLTQRNLDKADEIMMEL